MRKKVGIIKRISCISLVFLLSINSFAAIVSDNDGAAFITKAEFDALKNNFQSQIDQYNQSIDSKIDGAIASYLAGIRLSTQMELTCIYDKLKISGTTSSANTKIYWLKNNSSNRYLMNSASNLLTTYHLYFYGYRSKADEAGYTGLWGKSPSTFTSYTSFISNGEKAVKVGKLTLFLYVAGEYIYTGDGSSMATSFTEAINYFPTKLYTSTLSGYGGNTNAASGSKSLYDKTFGFFLAEKQEDVSNNTIYFAHPDAENNLDYWINNTRSTVGWISTSNETIINGATRYDPKSLGMVNGGSLSGSLDFPKDPKATGLTNLINYQSVSYADLDTLTGFNNQTGITGICYCTTDKAGTLDVSCTWSSQCSVEFVVKATLPTETDYDATNPNYYKSTNKTTHTFTIPVQAHDSLFIRVLPSGSSDVYKTGASTDHLTLILQS